MDRKSGVLGMIPRSGEPRLNYISKVVLTMGVPPLWIEDAVQDCEIKLWRAGRDDGIILRRAAIDAARKYGRRSRYGDRPQQEPLDSIHPIRSDNEGQIPQLTVLDSTDIINRMIDIQRIVKEYPPGPGALRALKKYEFGIRTTNSEQVMLYQWRTRIRLAQALANSQD